MQEFDYLSSNLSIRFTEELEGRCIEMFKREVRERAGLLFNLRFSQEEAVRRIESNIRWEFDDTWTRKEPLILPAVKDLVADVYRKRSSRPEG